jgi:hypothetical protein
MSTEQSAPAFALTWHAVNQMDARSLSTDAVTSVLAYGRHAWTRGACIFVIGRREVEHYRSLGINLDPYEGVQVVTTADGTILTVYRNRNLRGMRHRHRRSKRGMRSVWSTQELIQEQPEIEVSGLAAATALEQ